MDTQSEPELQSPAPCVPALCRNACPLHRYTAASATGRMPCSDIADAIVLFGRDTLERSIRIVNSHKEWGARVWPCQSSARQHHRTQRHWDGDPNTRDALDWEER